LIVNPYDTEGVGNAIVRALTMPLRERQRRHEELFRVLCENDISRWADRFLTVLKKPLVEPELPLRLRVVK